MVTGDQVLIAKEMSRMLGLGVNIPNADGLPKFDADGKVPSNLGEKYGQMILDADGFAQVQYVSLVAFNCGACML